MSDDTAPRLTFNTIGQEIRLHALNLAAALHKDTIRFLDKDDARPAEVGDLVLTDARRFAAWLKYGDRYADPDDEPDEAVA